MSTRGQFNTKNPTIKRILKEASELASQPSLDYHAEPLDDNLFEWHFTLRGPPAPSPYTDGIYHGRIVLPPQYPLRPPSFRFLTPTGRFEVNREICLSISGHHEETWQPAWGIRTALVAMRSFMDTDAKGQLGGLEATKEVRERMAREGAAWRCGVCAKTNGVILKEREELGAERAAQEEAVPEELRLAYRDELGQKDAKTEKQAGPATEAASSSLPPAVNDTVAPPPNPLPVAPAAPVPTRTVQAQPPVVRQIVRPSPDRSLAWIDTCIYGIGAALIFLVLKKFAS